MAIRSTERTAWRKAAWCAAAGIGVSTLDRLPPEKQPKRVQLFKQQHIIEDPGSWWARIARIARMEQQRAGKKT